MPKTMFFPLFFFLMFAKNNVVISKEPQEKYFIDNNVDTIPAQEEIYIDVVPNAIKSSKDSIVLVIPNNCQDTILFGSDFSLEKFTNNNWQEADYKKNAAFNDDGWRLQPEKTVTQRISLLQFINVTKGKYRVVKKFRHSSKHTIDTIASSEFFIEN